MKVNGLEIYAVDQQERVGTQSVEQPYQNDGGDFLYADPNDPSSQGWMTETEGGGLGWVKKTRPVDEPVFMPTRGTFASIQMIEADADGNAINLRTEGYDAWLPIHKHELLAYAQEDPNIAAKHEAFVTAAREYMFALEALANS